MKKRLLGALGAMTLCLLLLCGCGKEETATPSQKLGNNDPANLTATTLTLTGATAKAGDTVELQLSVEESSDLWGFSWEVHYDDTVLTSVSAAASDAYLANFEMDVTSNVNPLIVQGAGREIQNYEMTGTVATLTFRVADNAAPGEYAVNVGCKEGNNIDVDSQEIPFTPVTAIVKVEA